MPIRLRGSSESTSQSSSMRARRPWFLSWARTLRLLTEVVPESELPRLVDLLICSRRCSPLFTRMAFRDCIVPVFQHIIYAFLHRIMHGTTTIGRMRRMPKIRRSPVLTGEGFRGFVSLITTRSGSSLLSPERHAREPREP